jgi:hypothetical protein
MLIDAPSVDVSKSLPCTIAAVYISTSTVTRVQHRTAPRIQCSTADGLSVGAQKVAWCVHRWMIRCIVYVVACLQHNTALQALLAFVAVGV